MSWPEDVQSFPSKCQTAAAIPTRRLDAHDPGLGALQLVELVSIASWPDSVILCEPDCRTIVPMTQERSTIPRGIAVLVPSVFEDPRGSFSVSYNRMRFGEDVGLHPEFVQDNHSRSIKGVLRGLHYQLPPMAQGKLVHVVRGAVFDVAVDIRESSSTFGRWFGVELTDENRKQLWVPPGFAHGFLTLSDGVDLVYKVTQYYSPDHDRAIRWDDPDIGIDWPDIGAGPLLSPKDADAPLFRDAEIFE